MKKSAVVVIACLALATGAFAADWTAYNDTFPEVGDSNPANTTEWGLGTAAPGTSGLLLDFGSGAATGATVTVIGTGVNTSGGTGGGVPSVGDANDLFTDKVDLNKLIYYSAADWTVDLVFSGLDPNETYTLAGLHNRNNYTNRWSVVSIAGADAFTYAASAGSYKISDSAVSLLSNQTPTGYVAKWTDIDPGADGGFSITYTYATAANGGIPPLETQDGVKAYGPGAFMLLSGAGGEPPPPPPPPPPTGSFELRVSGGSNDAEEHLTDFDGVANRMDVTSTDLELGSEGGTGDDQLIGLRFRNVQIPVGSTIESASIQFHADETDAEITSLLIFGELEANPLAYTTTNSDISSRTVTVESVAWDNIPEWDLVHEEGPDQETPDISSIIQEIIDLGGWAPGNSLAIMMAQTSVNGERTAESVEGESGSAPVLKITYTPEPATMSLLGLGALAMIRRRKR